MEVNEAIYNMRLQKRLSQQQGHIPKALILRNLYEIREKKEATLLDDE